MSGTLASIIIVPYFCPMAQLANLRRIVIAGSKVWNPHPAQLLVSRRTTRYNARVYCPCPQQLGGGFGAFVHGATIID